MRHSQFARSCNLALRCFVRWSLLFALVLDQDLFVFTLTESVESLLGCFQVSFGYSGVCETVAQAAFCFRFPYCFDWRGLEWPVCHSMTRNIGGTFARLSEHRVAPGTEAGIGRRKWLAFRSQKYADYSIDKVWDPWSSGRCSHVTFRCYWVPTCDRTWPRPLCLSADALVEGQ